MADFNRLLIVPFHERWRVRERLRRGESIYGGGIKYLAPAEDQSSGWQAKDPPLPPDATSVAFKLLGLEAATATADDVRRRFKELAFDHHPDRGGDVKKFHAISDARNRCLAALKPL